MNAKLPPVHLAIVDYGLGNLFSVKHACERVGMRASVTSSRDAIFAADGILLPGVGAFGDAMACLDRLDLSDALRSAASNGQPLIGICLGMQLLMSEGHEFGLHQGLDILPGKVIKLDRPQGPRGTLKVPQVGWNRIRKPAPQAWERTPLAGLPDGASMYFVHSFMVSPDDASMCLASTVYGHIEFCSAICHRNVLGFQFHPERSGRAGLKAYSQIPEFIRHCQSAKEGRHAA